MTAISPRKDGPGMRLHSFIVYAEDRPGVLNRITSLFSRRNYNIDSLTAGRTHKPGVSRLTIVVWCDSTTALLVEANLYKLVNVLRVENVTDVPTVVRDLALIKVMASEENRTKVMQICEVFRARVVDVTPTALSIETTGTEEKLQGLIEMLTPFGIVEMVRTGAVAIIRGPEATTIDPHFVAARVPREGSTTNNTQNT